MNLETLLTGTHVRVWPYAAGLYSPHLLPALWEVFSASEDFPRVFWDYARPSAITLQDFLVLAERKLLLIVEDLSTHDFAGLCWFDEVRTHRAAIVVWYRRQAWGQKAREGTRIALDYGFAIHGWQAVWASTPWKIAVKHAEAVGAKLIATLPGYACIHGVLKDVYVLKKEGPEGPTPPKWRKERA